jgi:hypothetical protein
MKMVIIEEQLIMDVLLVVQQPRLEHQSLEAKFIGP